MAPPRPEPTQKIQCNFHLDARGEVQNGDKALEEGERVGLKENSQAMKLNFNFCDTEQERDQWGGNVNCVFASYGLLLF